jgi:hypothetical protein
MSIAHQLFDYMNNYERLTTKRPAAVPITYCETVELLSLIKDNFLISGSHGLPASLGSFIAGRE